MSDGLVQDATTTPVLGFVPPPEMTINRYRNELAFARDEVLTLKIQNEFLENIVRSLQAQLDSLTHTHEHDEPDHDVFIKDEVKVEAEVDEKGFPEKASAYGLD